MMFQIILIFRSGWKVKNKLRKELFKIFRNSQKIGIKMYWIKFFYYEEYLFYKVDFFLLLFELVNVKFL